MRVVLCQTKNGLPSFLAFSIKAKSEAKNTSSTVSMLSLAFGSSPGCGGKGPSSWILCLPILPQRGCTVGSSASAVQQWRTLRGPYLARKAGSFGYENQYGSDKASR